MKHKIYSRFVLSLPPNIQKKKKKRGRGGGGGTGSQFLEGVAGKEEVDFF